MRFLTLGEGTSQIGDIKKVVKEINLKLMLL